MRPSWLCWSVLLAGCVPNSFGADESAVDMGPPPKCFGSAGGGQGELGALVLGLGAFSFELLVGAFATGATAELTMERTVGGPTVTAVTSTHPEVLSAKFSKVPIGTCSIGIVEVQAIGKGLSELIFKDEHLEVVDRFVLQVADTDVLTTEPGLGDEPRLVGALYSPFVMHVITERSNGDVLHGIGAPSYLGSGAVASAIPLLSLDDGSGFERTADAVRFQIEDGEGSLVLSAPGTMRTLSFRGVRPSEIDDLVLDVGNLQQISAAEWSFMLQPFALVGGTIVDAMPCDSIDLDTIGFQPGLRDPVLGAPARYDFRALATSGDYTLSCTVGAITATQTLHIP